MPLNLQEETRNPPEERYMVIRVEQFVLVNTRDLGAREVRRQDQLRLDQREEETENDDHR